MIRIKELRTEMHKSLRDVACELNISYSSLSKYERGDQQPSYETLIKMADYFDVTADYLIGRTSCKNIENQPFSDSLGIDEKTIDILKSLAVNPDDDYTDDITELDYLEAIMQHPQFHTLMLQINSYYVYTTADWSNHLPYSISFNGREIPITIEDLKNSELQLIQTTFKSIVEGIPTSPHILDKE